MHRNANQTYRAVQQALQERYDLQVDYQVEHFISHDSALVERLTGQSIASQEMLLVHENQGDLDITLFLDPALMETLLEQARHQDNSESFSNHCILLEGISHFVYLVWNAQFGRQVKPVEMELQAEVDKFVFNALDNTDIGVDTHFKRLRNRLFKNVNYTHAPGTELYRRYCTANRYAQQYCSWLARRYEMTANDIDLNAELARFYRMGASAKFHHIRLRAC